MPPKLNHRQLITSTIKTICWYKNKYQCIQPHIKQSHPASIWIICVGCNSNDPENEKEFNFVNVQCGRHNLPHNTTRISTHNGLTSTGGTLNPFPSWMYWWCCKVGSWQLFPHIEGKKISPHWWQQQMMFHTTFPTPQHPATVVSKTFSHLLMLVTVSRLGCYGYESCCGLTQVYVIKATFQRQLQ